MQQYYDYIIGETTYNDKECYTFTIRAKEGLSSRDKKKALIRKIVSFFDKENFKVIYREYKFVYSNWFLDLDMDITDNFITSKLKKRGRDYYSCSYILRISNSICTPGCKHYLV